MHTEDDENIYIHEDDDLFWWIQIQFKCAECMFHEAIILKTCVCQL